MISRIATSGIVTWKRLQGKGGHFRESPLHCNLLHCKSKGGISESQHQSTPALNLSRLLAPFSFDPHLLSSSAGFVIVATPSELNLHLVNFLKG